MARPLAHETSDGSSASVSDPNGVCAGVMGGGDTNADCLPLVLASLPAPWNGTIGRFTILLASYQMVALHPRSDLLSAGLSMVVVLTWPAAALVLAAALINRDA